MLSAIIAKWVRTRDDACAKSQNSMGGGKGVEKCASCGVDTHRGADKVCEKDDTGSCRGTRGVTHCSTALPSL